MMFDVVSVTNIVANWVITQPSIRGLALVGSYARASARPDSDIDVFMVAIDPDVFRSDRWVTTIALPEVRSLRWQDETYGAVWSRRIIFDPHVELEMSFAPLSWASIVPIDAGTRRVVSDGFNVLHDPDGLLTKLCLHCH